MQRKKNDTRRFGIGFDNHTTIDGADMKIYIGPYTRWFGPYQLAELLCFWAKKEKDEFGMERPPEWVHHFGEWLAHGSIEPDQKPGEIRTWDRERHYTWIYKFLTWIESKKKRRIYVKIDSYDTWNMDGTLAYIILPMLKQLKEHKHGSQQVDLEDVPEEMRLISHEDYDPQACFDFYHEPNLQNIQCDVHDRWDWVLDEMIFAFESYMRNWEDKYHSGEMDIQWKQLEGGMSEMIHSPDHTHAFDREGWEKEHKRIQNGLRLFGKYYKGLWD